MKIEDSVMSEILRSEVWARQGVTVKLDENKEVEKEEKEEEVVVVEEAVEEDHYCPLCDSKLEEALSDEKLEEHVEYILNVINESEDSEGEDLDEETSTEDEDNAEW